MTGGLIQLVAYGVQDIFLTYDPQITFFKIVYRRHTNFSVEPIRQNFISNPDFGKRATCLIAKNGDLIGKSYLVITLPTIKQFSTITKFAWVRKIGFAIINNVEIEIGGLLIDKHYGEWLNIWSELTTSFKENGFNQMIGNVPELTNFTNSKDSFTLYVPLQFWFCREYSIALPIIALHYSDVKINIEFNDLSKCYLLSPTNYIEIENDIINFADFEYIEQNINGKIASGLFISFDVLTKRIYYSSISTQQFTSMVVDENSLTPADRRTAVYNSQNSQYWIRGLMSNVIAMPKFNTSSKVYTPDRLTNVFITDCHLLIEYIFLDEIERLKFTEARHDYMIEQLIQVNEQIIESPNRTVHIDLIQPSKLLVWVVQYTSSINNNDTFNYTDSYKYDSSGKLLGNTLVKTETILFNGHERISNREFNYFNYTQQYQHFKYATNEGINIYSLALFPNSAFPSGSCNMSQIENINIQLQLNSNVTILNTTKFRGYSLGYNIYRIINGIGGIVFTR